MSTGGKDAAKQNSTSKHMRARFIFREMWTRASAHNLFRGIFARIEDVNGTLTEREKKCRKKRNRCTGGIVRYAGPAQAFKCRRRGMGMFSRALAHGCISQMRQRARGSTDNVFSSSRKPQRWEEASSKGHASVRS